MKRRNISRIRPAAPPDKQIFQKVRILSLTLTCVGLVAAGFFFAARQHFATMEFGLKNSQLRKQVENLEAERRRLILAKEVSLSPAEIKQTASKLGFREQLTAPPSSSDSRIETPIPRTGTVAPELASFKQQAGPLTSAPSESNEKKLVKPIVQQTTVNAASNAGRPRIVGSETVASISAKPSAKLR